MKYFSCACRYTCTYLCAYMLVLAAAAVLCGSIAISAAGNFSIDNQTSKQIAVDIWRGDSWIMSLSLFPDQSTADLPQVKKDIDDNVRDALKLYPFDKGEKEYLHFQISFGKDQTCDLIYEGDLPRNAQITVLGFHFDDHQELGAVWDKTSKQKFPSEYAYKFLERMNKEYKEKGVHVTGPKRGRK